MAYREDAGSTGSVASTDDVLYVYTDADTITVQEGGTFTASDGTAYEVASDTAVTLSGALSADVVGGEANSTLYYLCGGTKVSDSLLGFFFTDSATVLPSELSKGRRLRGGAYNDGSGNIVSFGMSQQFYYYEIAAIYGGSDVLEVLDAAVATTFTDVDCSAFIPSGTKFVLVGMTLSAVGNHTIRRNGESHTGIGIVFHSAAGAYAQYMAHLDGSGIYECKNDASLTTRISLIGYQLN